MLCSGVLGWSCDLQLTLLTGSITRAPWPVSMLLVPQHGSEPVEGTFGQGIAASQMPLPKSGGGNSQEGHDSLCMGGKEEPLVAQLDHKTIIEEIF